MWTSTLGQFCVTAIPDKRILPLVARAPTSSIGFSPDARLVLAGAHERQTKNRWGSEQPDSSSEAHAQAQAQAQEARSSQPARFRGMGPGIRRGLGRGDIVEGLLFFLGRGLWWWWWTAMDIPTHS